MQQTNYKVKYKGVCLDVDFTHSTSILDGLKWVYTQEVRHAGESITDILGPLALSQIDHIIEKELNS